MQIAEEEIHVEATFVSLIEDQGVVTQQAPVALYLGEQNPVGHQLDQGAIAGLVGEAHGVTDRLNAHPPVCVQRRTQLIAYPFGHRAGRQPSGLGVSDGTADTAAQLQADLGELGGLAGSGLAGDNHHLVLADGLG